MQEQPSTVKRQNSFKEDNGYRGLNVYKANNGTIFYDDDIAYEDENPKITYFIKRFYCDGENFENYWLEEIKNLFNFFNFNKAERLDPALVKLRIEEEQEDKDFIKFMFDVVIENNFHEILEAFINLGGDLNLRNDNGQTISQAIEAERLRRLAIWHQYNFSAIEVDEKEAEEESFNPTI